MTKVHGMVPGAKAIEYLENVTSTSFQHSVELVGHA